MFFRRMIEISRNQKNWSRSDLAAAIGTSYDQVYQWETGKRTPKFENVMKIANATNVEIGFFYTEFEDFEDWVNTEACPDVNYEMGL